MAFRIGEMVLGMDELEWTFSIQIPLIYFVKTPKDQPKKQVDAIFFH